MVTSNLKTQHMLPVSSESGDASAGSARAVNFLDAFASDRACLDYILHKRFGRRIKCPKCERTAKFHKIRQIPAYACQWCGYHLHPMAHTRFARTRVGLHQWFHAIYLFANADNGISARELQRALDLTYKTAWRMRSTILEAKAELRAGSRKGNPTIDVQSLLDVLLTPRPDKRLTPDKGRKLV